MKKILLLTLILSSVTADAKKLERTQLQDPSTLKEVFTNPTNSKYKPLEVYGIITFLLQNSVNNGYNYEIAGITWEDMSIAILGKPDEIIEKLGTGFIWKEIESTKVLIGINLRHYTDSNLFSGNFDGSYFQNLETLLLGANDINSLNLLKNPNLTTLVCNSEKLTNLDISGCTNLIKLECKNNKLAKLDISKNVNLEELKCTNNPDLETLDFSNNPNLILINCQNNNLASIDVSNNRKLEVLDIGGNKKINSLDLSDNPNLKKLICFSTKIESLDLSNAVNLEHLNCNGAKLTNLDLSKNINLEALLFGGTKITSIDLQNNTKLTRLLFHNSLLTSIDLSKNINLTRLKFYNTNLESIDLSKNAKLTELICYGNKKLTELNITQNTQLVDVDCSSNSLKFSTLVHSQLPSKLFKYSPQLIINGGKIEYIDSIDLSSEYDIKGNITNYKWYNKETNKEVTISGDNGVFYPGEKNAGKSLICKMTNSQFPELTLEYEVSIKKQLTEKIQISDQEESLKNISVFPNPVNSQLTIDSPSKVKSVNVLNYSSKSVKKINSVNNNQINLQELTSGIYVLNIETDKEIYTQKIIKE